MSATGLDVFDTTLQKTNGWLHEIENAIGWDNQQEAYLALRGTLHALRDYLMVDESAHLAAQLPMLVRGIYFDGWDPSAVPADNRGKEDFLRRVGAEFKRARKIDPEQAARATLGVLSHEIDPRYAAEVRRLMPADVRALWPETS